MPTKPTTPKPAGRKLADFRKEATREPYVLDLDDGTQIVIPQPTNAQLLAIDDAATGREVLEAICGDQAKVLMDAVANEPGGVLAAIADDIAEHFRLGESGGSRS